MFLLLLQVLLSLRRLLLHRVGLLLQLPLKLTDLLSLSLELLYALVHLHLLLFEYLLELFLTLPLLSLDLLKLLVPLCLSLVELVGKPLLFSLQLGHYLFEVVSLLLCALDLLLGDPTELGLLLPLAFLELLHLLESIIVHLPQICGLLIRHLLFIEDLDLLDL